MERPELEAWLEQSQEVLNAEMLDREDLLRQAYDTLCSDVEAGELTVAEAQDMYNLYREQYGW